MTRPLLVAWLVITVMLASAPSAQQAQAPEGSPSPAFEVASVKLSDPNATGPLGQIPMIMPQGTGRLSATNVPLRLLIRMVYQVQDFQIVGGPSWQMSQRFDIVAKAEDGAATDTQQLMPMLKSLLADRFKLKTHTETREMPISTLVVARSDGKLGPNLKPSTADCTNARAEQQKRAEAILKGGPGALANALPKPGETMTCMMMPMGGAEGFGLRASGQPMTMLVQLLTQATGKIVQDKTGLTGLYDFELRFDPEVLMRMASQVGVNLPPGVAPPPSDSPSLLTALREQLGLKVDSDKGPVDVLVIDSAEMPTPD
jgi:uncharacterized protein (TIGR03435 family)